MPANDEASLVSVIVPTFNGADYIGQTLQGLLAQTYSNLEIIVVDDCSTDDTCEVVREFAARDARLCLIEHAENGGTLLARRNGVLASKGDYVMLADQDDELVPSAVERMVAEMQAEPVDILQCGVRVVAENPAATEAAAGMQGFLTPPARRLEGADILRLQFAEQDGFDWQVHHKLYRGDMLRGAYAEASDAFLIFADDAYVNFIICAKARSYRALEDAPFYVYHLGRGETFGAKYTLKSFTRLLEADSQALALARSYAHSPEHADACPDWEGRVADLRDRLASHVMNEWKDNISEDDKSEALKAICAAWTGDAVAAELYRYARDYAYGLISGEGKSPDDVERARDRALYYWSLACDIEGASSECEACNKRLAAMRKAAREYLAEAFLGNTPDNQKLEAARAAEEALGAGAIATELMRLARDRAYEVWDGNASLQGDEPFLDWYRFAVDAAGHKPPAEYADYYRSMRQTLSDLYMRDFSNDAVSLSASAADQPVRIFVSTHKDVERFESDILQPVQVGCALRGDRFDWAFHDDEGENISALNPMYCELTTQYWAWKNVDAEYYGFCHYRRYFDFSDERHDEAAFGEVMDGYINRDAQKRYALDDESIIKAVRGYDIVTTEFKDLSEFPGNTNTPYEHWEAASAANMLHLEDLEHMASLIKEMTPECAQDVDDFLNGGTSCFCNMFIMRKELFFEYCEWLFPILERFVAETDMSHYSKEALRTPGHLSERMLNIWYRHKVRTGTQWKAKQIQCVHFEHPERRVPFNIEVGPEGHGSLIPVVFAADNNYVPMLTTAIYSMLVNASPSFYYDVVVLEKDIDQRAKDRMTSFFAEKFPNAGLRFCNVCRLVDGYDLSTYNPHISGETYYRFLIQELLPYYSKVVYLDADLIIQDDISKLYATRLGDNLVAAVKDIDFHAHVNTANGDRMEYALNTLGMKDPYGYFQAGVLLLNTNGLRKLHSLDYWLKLASDPKLIYNDQDALNACCEGRVLYLDMSWNVMINCVDRIYVIYPHAPSAVYEEFLNARAHERIIHYAGIDKPWVWRDCDRAEEYWRYARETPFYEKLMGRLAFEEATRASAEERARAAEAAQAAGQGAYVPAPAMGEGNPLRKVIDPLMPLGSNRREVAKAVGRAIRGRK